MSGAFSADTHFSSSFLQSQVRIAAHTLKSSSANVGATGLTELCRALEAEARSGTIPDAAGRVSECRRAFEDVRAALLAERAARG